MPGSPAIVWFRRNLRLADNPALTAALADYGSVVPVYVHAPAEDGAWAPGPASRAWLARSLAALDTSLRKRGSRLVVAEGPSADTLARIAAETGARAVYFDRRFEPEAEARDARMMADLTGRFVMPRPVECALILGAEDVRTAEGLPYRVFTPFYNACLSRGPARAPLPAPDRVPTPERLPAGGDAGRLAPSSAETPGLDLDAHWTPGEAGAHALAERFFETALASYAEGRERPDLDLTSRLSPHLAFGEVSAVQLLADAERVAASTGGVGAEAWVRQLFWREFAHHLLRHFPDTPERPLREQFEAFPWRRDDAALDAWAEGRTGFPLVDAGMRQLRATGWMHNRVRMVVASFLAKDLLLPWQDGARLFWERLADADLANNTLGWQWVAGCGADAAPYFRVFNPALQAAKHDPDGAYVRRWVPELDTPEYPKPIVDHAEARKRALAAYASVRGGKE